MNKKKEQLNACAVKTSIGGQALIEGIMMRGPLTTAMAVRNPAGEMVLEKWDTETKKIPAVLKLPLIRGVVNFILSMKTGYKSLMRSAEIAMPEELAQSKEENKDAPESQDPTGEKDKKKSGTSVLLTAVMAIASVLGVALSVVLFIMLPSYIYKGLVWLIPAIEGENIALNSLIKSVFEGFLKIAVLVAYMALVSLMKDIRRTFMYHGAEHKTIFCYEHGKELTVQNVREEQRFHPRCGTSFLILMLLVGMFFSFFIDPLFLLATGSVPPTFIRVIIKLLMLPLFMGVGYELIKVAGKHDNIVTRIISAPGMWLQHVTVLEPTDDMIECAIAAFTEVIPKDDSDKINK